MSSREIVVGTDGSGPANGAVKWAAAEAAKRHVSLRILVAYDWPWHGAPLGVANDYQRAARGPAEDLAGAAVDEVARTHPGLSVTGAAVLGDPADVLLAASPDAGLLVVGNRGRGGFGSLLLGSVSQRIATHASCPVVVVRGPDIDGPVVVGVDGSPGAVEALGAAFEYAATHDRPLTAIRAYRVPAAPWGVEAPPRTIDPDFVHAAERQELEESLAPWREKYPDVQVTALAAPGGSADVLVAISGRANLLVVGSRGHGQFAGTLLGSVGLTLLHHAECPLLIVRHPTMS